MFQFTRPRGARPRGTSRKSVFHVVSIHAPTGGATDFPAGCARAQCFNSRAHGGRDLPRTSPRVAPLFQFTRPRGARQVRKARRVARCCFNSRAHGGRDTLTVLACGKITAFQFTRPRGARPRPGPKATTTHVSIHAPTGGATDAEVRQEAVRVVSIHAPTGGATFRHCRR